VPGRLAVDPVGDLRAEISAETPARTTMASGGTFSAGGQSDP